jgi:hypothetical protein
MNSILSSIQYLTVLQNAPDPLGDNGDFGGWVEAGINGTLKDLADVAPGLVLAVVMVGVFHVAGGRVSDRITTFLHRSEVGASVSETPLGSLSEDEEFVPRMLGSFVYYYLLLLGLTIGTGYLPVQDLPARLGTLLGYFQSLFTALLVVVVGVALVGAISSHVSDKEQLAGTTLGALTQTVVEVLLYLLVFVFGASILGAGVGGAGGALQLLVVVLLAIVLSVALIVGMGDRKLGDVLDG